MRGRESEGTREGVREREWRSEGEREKMGGNKGGVCEAGMVSLWWSLHVHVYDCVSRGDRLHTAPMDGAGCKNKTTSKCVWWTLFQHHLQELQVVSPQTHITLLFASRNNGPDRPGKRWCTILVALVKVPHANGSHEVLVIAHGEEDVLLPQLIDEVHS